MSILDCFLAAVQVPANEGKVWQKDIAVAPGGVSEIDKIWVTGTFDGMSIPTGNHAYVVRKNGNIIQSGNANFGSGSYGTGALIQMIYMGGNGYPVSQGDVINLTLTYNGWIHSTDNESISFEVTWTEDSITLFKRLLQAGTYNSGSALNLTSSFVLAATKKHVVTTVIHILTSFIQDPTKQYSYYVWKNGVLVLSGSANHSASNHTVKVISYGFDINNGDTIEGKVTLPACTHPTGIAIAYFNFIMYDA